MVRGREGGKIAANVAASIPKLIEDVVHHLRGMNLKATDREVIGFLLTRYPEPDSSSFFLRKS